ncbi:MAG: ankyrin repeat protein [Planctomycetota bacterium]|jgi:ankyrin repeat protein
MKLLAVLLLGLVVSGCAVRNDWAKARRADNPHSYELFLEKYPTSDYTAEAQDRWEASLFSVIQLASEKGANTRGLIEIYQKQFSDAPHRNDVERLLLEYDFGVALKSGSLRVYREFLSTYPGTVQAQEIREIAAKRTWEELASSDRVEELEIFLVDFGETSQGASARQHLAVLKLFLAARTGDVRILHALVDGGVDVDVTDADSKSSLHLAVVSNRADSVRALLERGADPEQSDADELTPLHLACLGDASECLKVLVEWGAHLECQSGDRSTPLIMSTTKGNVEAVRLLLEFGADVSARNDAGAHALLVACLNDRSDLVDLLLEAGAPLDYMYEGCSILMHAVRACGDGVIRRLIEEGADFHALDDDRMNALHYAAHWGNIEAVRILLDAGVAADSISRSGWTPYAKARDHGHEEVLELLLEHGVEVTPIPPQGAKTILVLDHEVFQRSNLAEGSYSPPDYSKFKIVVHIAEPSRQYTQDKTGAPAYLSVTSGIDDEIGVERCFETIVDMASLIIGRKVGPGTYRRDGTADLTVTPMGVAGTRMTFLGDAQHPFEPIPGLKVWQGALEVDLDGRLWILPGTQGGFSE